MKKSIIFPLIALALSIVLSPPDTAAQKSQSADVLLGAALHQEEVEGNLEAAIETYKKLLAEFPGNRPLAAKAQLHLGLCYKKLGLKQAQEAFRKVVENYPEQSEAVKAAQAKLALFMKAPTPAAKSDKEFHLRQVWAGPGAKFGAVSPDGRSIAFQDSGSGDLAIRDIETGQEKRLTKKGSWTTAEQFIVGRWSPDGKKIAYGWFNKDNYVDLRLIRTDGSEARILFQDKDCHILPTGWSPDGKFILAGVQKKNTEYQIAVVSAADGSVQVLKTSTIPPGGLSMSFSPDGKYIAYDSLQLPNSKENDIFLLSRDGKQEIRLAEHPAHDTFLGWVPNLNVLLFASDRAVSTDVWMIHTSDGRPLGEPILIKKDIGRIEPLGITDKGSFFYGTASYMVDIFEAAVDLDKGVIVDPPKKLSQKFMGPLHSPKWSPDGKSLAYLVERREPSKPSAFFLCVRTDKKEEECSIPMPISSIYALSWSSDGRSFFATVEDENGRQGLFRIDPETGGLTLLAQSEPDSIIKAFAVSPDGKSLFYASFQLKKKLASIFKRDLATGQEKEIYRKAAPPEIGSMIVSPDARYLSFSSSDGASNQGYVIRIIDLADGRTRDILQGKLDSSAPHIWTRDGKSILFIKRISSSKTEKRELWQVPAAGGEPTKISLDIESMRNLQLHPDGKRIVFTSEKIVQEVWVMENFLPKEKSAGLSKSR